ncbi:MAG: hypothetical protein LBR84_04530 [Tannerella sp.]|jgi:hypothetical protein|nr:hypothetical protein [Tannerella sp.]
MRRQKFLASIALMTILLLCAECNKCKRVEVDIETLQSEFYEPGAVEYPALAPGVSLYLDHSTCVVEARRNSAVFNAMRPQLGQYSDTLVLIKGRDFETVPLDRANNQVFAILQNINEDIPYSDILKAVNQICSSDHQAILITDCEFLEQRSKAGGGDLCHDEDPYLSEPIKRWLQKGHVIYVITEPYKETTRGKTYDKKRFYFIFTDDKLQAPISDNMQAQLEPLDGQGLFTIFKLTNSDIQVRLQGGLIAEELTFNMEEKPGFEYVEIDDSWDDIREYVMKLDKYGEPLEEETPVPLIKNLVFNKGNNYAIADVELLATNITDLYDYKTEIASASESDEEEEGASGSAQTSVPKPVIIPDGFVIDKEALKNNTLNVMVTDGIFNHLNECGNLIRIDFVTTSVSLNQYSKEVFEWQSLILNQKAVCVSLSIDNALRDAAVVPTSSERRVIHTIFLKTREFKY